MSVVCKNSKGVEVVKSEEVVKAQVYLRKFNLPDVLIDIIQDYVYISKAMVIQRYWFNETRIKISNMWVAYSLEYDTEGKVRSTHWHKCYSSIWNTEEVFLQNSTCTKCGESYFVHPNGLYCQEGWDKVPAGKPALHDDWMYDHPIYVGLQTFPEEENLLVPSIFDDVYDF